MAIVHLTLQRFFTHVTALRLYLFGQPGVITRQLLLSLYRMEDTPFEHAQLFPLSQTD